MGLCYAIYFVGAFTQFASTEPSHFRNVVNCNDLNFLQSLVSVSPSMTISGIFGVNNGDKVNTVIRLHNGNVAAIFSRSVSPRITLYNSDMFPKYR